MKKRIISLISVLFLLCCIFTVLPTSTTVKAESEKAMAVIEKSSGRVLYSYNENAKLPMASTTKIVTCITVIENCEDLDKVVAVPDCAVGVEGSSIYLKRGEKLKIRDLLYGLMLRSGNDCAVALAMTVGGNVENFAKLMNETARKAGAENTNFVNPHGLHDDNHYTTALDLAKISAYAMKNKEFYEIVSTKQKRIPYGEEDYDRVLLNKNKILSRVEGADGVKTGYTKKAGRCLVSSATRDGMNVICVVLNCPDMFARSESLINKAFLEYELTEVLSMQSSTEAEVVGGKLEKVELAPKSSFVYPLKSNEKERIQILVSDVKKMQAPIKKEIKNGKIEVFLDKQLLFSDNLFTIYSVEGKSFWDKIKDFWQN
jgi:D-alanyl-D-alanine carboxypeptidase (penicillin-binding protein 5/6)